MGKNKRRTIQILSRHLNLILDVDSEEEWQFICWLDQCIDNGLVETYEYLPLSFDLFSGYKYKDSKNKSRCALRGHIYTADFRIRLANSKYKDMLFDYFMVDNSLRKDNDWIYIDIKGGFAKNDGGRAFAINLKWVLEKHNVLIVKVVPEKLFEKFWLPSELRLTRKAKKPSKKYSDPKFRDFSEFENEASS